jgi:hypothetical protein
MFEPGDRVRYLYDPEIPHSWPHLNNVLGRVVAPDPGDADPDDGFVYVRFDFKPQLGALPCEPAELVKEKHNAIV